MFVLTKPEALTTSAFISSEVERQLAPLAYDVEQTEAGVTYKISSFAPGIRYSMFVPFAEVSIMRERGLWVLRMKPTKLLLLPFAIFIVGLLAFRIIGPIDFEGVLLAIALPTALVLLVLVESRLRLSSWWSKL
jgi:hypothetical protein